MSEATLLSGIVKAFSVAADMSGKSVLVADADGNIQKVSVAVLASAVAASGGMLRTVELAKNTPINANNLVAKNTMYITYTDVNQWDTSLDWLNMPTGRPAGGFALICIEEGNYKRQYYTCYKDDNIYMRFEHYQGAVIWSAWRMISSTALS